MATRSDSFDRADSSSLGVDWTEDYGDWAIASNNVRCDSTNDYQKARWTGAAMDSSNYYVEMPARSGAAAIGIGPAARLVGSATVSYYAYMIFGGDSAYLVYINGGSETILDTGSAITASTNYTLRIEVDGSTIRGYLNGSLDCEATNSALTAGAPGIASYGGSNANTYGTQWTAVDLASGTTYYSTPAGSLTPAGAANKRTSKRPAGSLTPTGAANKRTSKRPAGSVGLAGTVRKSTARRVAGSVGLAGVLAAVRTVLASVGGVLALAGTVAKQTARTLAGALTTAGNLATQLLAGVIEQAVGGALTLAGVVRKSTAKRVAGSVELAGGIVRQIGKQLAGSIGLAGSVVRNWFSPSAPKVDVTIGDAAQTMLAIGNARWTAVAATDMAQTVLTIGDAT
jgi:pectate lyase